MTRRIPTYRKDFTTSTITPTKATTIAEEKPLPKKAGTKNRAATGNKKTGVAGKKRKKVG
jgi:hypothetical protein